MGRGFFGHYLILLSGILAALWLVGLIIFVADIEQLAEPAISAKLESTDAIVVLTGGSERVSTGLALLNSRKSKKLFVSGVHRGLTLDRILAGQNVSRELRSCCITLGHAAESTIGNAIETRDWMNSEKAQSLRLVTANYHMPRSLMVFHTAMPNITIIAHPIIPDSVWLKDWWKHPGTANLLVTEYNKYLGTMVRLRLNNRI